MNRYIIFRRRNEHFCKVFNYFYKKHNNNALLVLGTFGLPTTNHTCVHDKFNCQDGTCIPINWRCDGEMDCKSEIDEYGCGKRLILTFLLIDCIFFNVTIAGERLQSFGLCSAIYLRLQQGHSEVDLTEKFNHCSNCCRVYGNLRLSC